MVLLRRRLMFDVDELIKDCERAVQENDSRRAIREVLDRAVADSSAVAGALEHDRAGLNLLHRSDTLTILNVVWAPGMVLQPHEHRMWAAIGIYAGQEDNAFFRRDTTTITRSGGKELHETDVLMLGDDAIHSVANPRRSHTGGIHVYGGDFVSTPRSEWDPVTLIERPYDYERILKQFEEANQSL
jgi:predicted metal-dependent enzyme (double-stranded beta helix superfamily)